MMKKLLLGIVGVLMFFGLSTQSASAFFSDMTTDYWAYKQISDLSEQGIVVGYPDGTFKPDENVTRAEFASMAIKALGQEHANVVQTIQFSDVDENYWARDAIEKAVYFDLISNDKDSDMFRPEDSVSRAEAMNIAVNSLTTEQISVQKAREILQKKYKDVNEIPDWFIVTAGKAEILDMFATIPDRTGYVDANRSATRAEVTAILNNMMIQAKLNPNAKLAEAMRKKTGEGYVISNSYVQGTVGTVPKGSLLPIKINKGFSSQTSFKGDGFTAIADQNYVTRDKYILVAKGTQFTGTLVKVQSGKWFVRNGVITLGTNVMNTPNNQNYMLETIGDVTIAKNKFMTWVRKVFKGEKLKFPQGGILYVQTLNEFKTDLTNGWVFSDK